jgi:hypothetical protein
MDGNFSDFTQMATVSDGRASLANLTRHHISQLDVLQLHRIREVDIVN